jgi:hypothetical protein
MHKIYRDNITALLEREVGGIPPTHLEYLLADVVDELVVEEMNNPAKKEWGSVFAEASLVMGLFVGTTMTYTLGYMKGVGFGVVTGVVAYLCLSQATKNMAFLNDRHVARKNRKFFLDAGYVRSDELDLRENIYSR